MAMILNRETDGETDVHSCNWQNAYLNGLAGTADRPCQSIPAEVSPSAYVPHRIKRLQPGHTRPMECPIALRDVVAEAIHT